MALLENVIEHKQGDTNVVALLENVIENKQDDIVALLESVIEEKQERTNKELPLHKNVRSSFTIPKAIDMSMSAFTQSEFDLQFEEERKGE